MEPDPVLEELICDQQYLIAADRYEELTGDASLAALMRIEGLEWELVEGKPGFKMTSHFTDQERWFWWNLRCGAYNFGSVGDNQRPQPPNDGTIFELIQLLGIQCEELADRFYRLYCDSVARECSL